MTSQIHIQLKDFCYLARRFEIPLLLVILYCPELDALLFQDITLAAYT